MELEEKIRELELLTRLWEQYAVPVLAEQVQDRVTSVFRKVVTPETIYQQEYVKGECVGLELASALPATLLEEAKRDLEKESEDGRTAQC